MELIETVAWFRSVWVVAVLVACKVQGFWEQRGAGLRSPES